VLGVLFGVLQRCQLFEDWQVDLPTLGFVFGGFLGLREQAGDVGKGAGAAGGETVGGEGVEEFSENVVDVDLGDVIVIGTGELGGEIVFAHLGLGLGLGVAKVSEAEALAFGVGREAAHAAVGKGELAKVEDIGWSGVGHNGERMANEYHSVNILVYTRRAHFILAYSNACGNVGRWISDISSQMSGNGRSASGVGKRGSVGEHPHP